MRGLSVRVLTIFSLISTIVVAPALEVRAAESTGSRSLPLAVPELQDDGVELQVVRRVVAARPKTRARSAWDAPKNAPRGFRPSQGQFAFRLAIPKIGLSERVREGVSQGVLARGLGHYPSCQSGFARPFCAPYRPVWPGEKGRMLVGGHRTISPHPFFDLGRLGRGDRIEIRAKWGDFLYRVHHVRVVGASNRSIVVPGVPRRELVLVTCHPKGSSRQRLLVFARLVAPRSG
jgi:sortase A